MAFFLHDKLQEIYQAKLKEVEQIDLTSMPQRNKPVVKLSDTIDKRDQKPALIAEIKKASPSKGIIREDFNLDAIIESYLKISPDAVSVLTDRTFFQGDAAYLQHFKSRSDIPVLRKDFIVSPLQIEESFKMGADIILLIVAMLQKEDLERMFHLAKEKGMDVLVETHTMEELEQALNLGADIIGVNNRNLKTFQVDLNNSIQMAKQIPSSVLSVAESGIETAEDIQQLKRAGFDAVLIGETFMRASNITATYKKLFG